MHFVDVDVTLLFFHPYKKQREFGIEVQTRVTYTKTFMKKRKRLNERS